MSITLKPGLTFSVAGAVTVFPGNIDGGLLQNPLSAANQGLGAAEVLLVDPINTPGNGAGDGWGTTFVLQPGEKWIPFPGQNSPTRVNAASSGHQFSAVYYVA